MAAVLAYGPGAVLSHRPGGAHWQIVSDRGPCEVTIPKARRSRPDIRVHEARLPADEITVHEGIPVTTVPRTLFDLAAGLPQRQLERAINEAEVLHLWDELSLDRLLHRYPRHRGNKAVRAALHRRREGSTVTKSELEEKRSGPEAKRATGTPAPVTSAGAAPAATRAAPGAPAATPAAPAAAAPPAGGGSSCGGGSG